MRNTNFVSDLLRFDNTILYVTTQELPLNVDKSTDSFAENGGKRGRKV